MPTPRIISLPFHEFIAQPRTTPRYLIDPYVPSGAIVLLHGKPGMGKSPLTWNMAYSVASGTPFLGRFPAAQGRVLYIDVDTPALDALVERMANLGFPMSDEVQANWRVVWGASGYNVLTTSDTMYHALVQERDTTPIQYAMVIINSLRKSYHADDRESWVPSRVYSAFGALFPEAALVFSGHDKKSSTDPKHKRVEHEEFAGSQAWFNDATSTMHLEAIGAANEGKRILTHTKLQVGKTAPKLYLNLDMDDGRTFTLVDQVTGVDVWTRYHQLTAGRFATMKKLAKLDEVAKQLNISPEKAYRLYQAHAISIGREEGAE